MNLTNTVSHGSRVALKDAGRGGVEVWQRKHLFKADANQSVSLKARNVAQDERPPFSLAPHWPVMPNTDILCNSTFQSPDQHVLLFYCLSQHSP